MDSKVKYIIDSGLLETYFLGLTDKEQTLEIDALLEKSDELKTRQIAFDLMLLDMTNSMAVRPPKDLKIKVQKKILDDATQAIKTTEGRVKQKPDNNKSKFIVIGSIGLLLICALAWVAYQNYRNNKILAEDLYYAKTELNTFRIQNKEMTNQMSQLIDEFAFLNNPSTEKYLLVGNSKASELKLIAYWNNVEKKSSISISNYPYLPKGKCLQMWADVNGKMISVGILNANKNFASIQYLEKAESLNITIEPIGGSEHPDVSNLVASITI